MKQRTRLWLGVVVVCITVCIILVQYITVPVAAVDRRTDAVWINRGGGSNSTGSDGLRARFNAPEQVIYANMPHLCCQNNAGNWGWGVSIGDISMSTGFGFSNDTWTSVDVLAWRGSVSFESDNNLTDTGDAYVLMRYRKVTATVPDPIEGDPNRTRDIYYTFDREIFYTYPNNYYTEKITAILPDENTVDVRIYKGGQVAPGQSRQTLAYQFDAPFRSVGEIGVTGGYAVGIRDVPGSQMSATYVGNPDDVAPYWTGLAFGDYLAPAQHAGGITAYWGIGTDPGVYKIHSEQYVVPQSTVIDAQFSQALITSSDDEPALLVTTTNYHSTIDQSGVGFRVTIPSNTTLGTPATSSCGGTVTIASTSVLVTGMTVPAKHQCVLTIPPQSPLPSPIRRQ
ncbi:MAG: hypothetical protein LW717_07730 [Chloroflexaceae bacterium]|nr:hypothetical protein [Chloroflexaceae bacterium]